MSTQQSTPRRARRSFWALVGLASLAMGSLSGALSARPGALTGLRVAASGVVLILALALAARVMIALERARLRRLHQAPGAVGGRKA